MFKVMRTHQLPLNPAGEVVFDEEELKKIILNSIDRRCAFRETIATIHSAELRPYVSNLAPKMLL